VVVPTLREITALGIGEANWQANAPYGVRIE
jgi:hypothetical protein